MKQSAFSLEQFQQRMQQTLIAPMSEQGRTFCEQINDSARLSAPQHLAIYQRSYFARLHHCMAAQFSALQYALGEELFEAFAADYLVQHPSQSHTLHDLGQHFAHYLQQTRPDADAEQKEDWPDFMIELADFEYSLNVLFDMQVPPQRYADNTTHNQQLTLQPAVRLFQHQFPILNYYRQFKNQQQPELPLPEANYALVVRYNYQLGLFDINRGQYVFLRLWQETGDWMQARERFIEAWGIEEGEFMRSWGVWRERWGEIGVLVYG